MDGCIAETIKATLVEAKNSNVYIDGVTGARIDLGKQRAEAAIAQAERERIAAEEQAEQDRIAAEGQAKEDAAEAARQQFKTGCWWYTAPEPEGQKGNSRYE